MELLEWRGSGSQAGPAGVSGPDLGAPTDESGSKGCVRLSLQPSTVLEALGGSRRKGRVLSELSVPGGLEGTRHNMSWYLCIPCTPQESCTGGTLNVLPPCPRPALCRLLPLWCLLGLACPLPSLLTTRAFFVFPPSMALWTPPSSTETCCSGLPALCSQCMSTCRPACHQLCHLATTALCCPLLYPQDLAQGLPLAKAPVIVSE